VTIATTDHLRNEKIPEELLEPKACKIDSYWSLASFLARSPDVCLSP
jgi:hypothetical protein